MRSELNLVFPDPQHVIIQSRTGSTQPFDFVNPLTANDLKDILWYLEVYSSQYMTDVDDDRARGIENSLSRWGSALFTAVLGQFAAQAAFMQFYNSKQAGRVLTIGASHPDILGLPWELLHIPGGGFLFNSNPRISIRRQFNVAGGFNLTEYQPKERVRILFIISRPRDAGFIDPRSDTQAVLAALKQEGRGRVDIEFLRPATIDALRQRLDDRRLPAIDIVHFDGHGVYDPDGRWFEEAKQSDGLELTRRTSADAANMGYLLFEDAEGDRALVSAEKLAATLNEQAIGLMILSACQSAMMGVAKKSAGESAGESAGDIQSENPVDEAMGSVAARLTHAGIPAVLAMTHSVLVTTTRMLFGEFYQNLMMGYGMGEALDNARRHLYLHQDRGSRQRGQERITLKLQDWFLPALYQAGADMPLLLDASAQDLAAAGNEAHNSAGFGNLPELQEAGFFGRSQELWNIERAFVRGTRRISLVGFGGQGKTFLAQEVGRWLCQTGMFARVCFVDYASFQGVDAVGLAVSTLGTMLNESLVDAQAATKALGQCATLLILDNLEALSAESLRGLLDAALLWSKAGRSRVLLTSRQPDFDHVGYKTVGSLEHICLTLGGLGSEAYPVDALNYFQALMKLPPAPTVPAPSREALVNLFELVDFHPLSIGLLAWQLKDRRPAELGQRLESLLAETGETDKDKSLVASLKLSLDRVGPEVRQWLPRLGVFQGGAFEEDLLVITGLGPTAQQVQMQQLKRAIEKLQRGEPVAEAESGLPPEEYQQLLQEPPEKLTEILVQLGGVGIAAGADESTWPMLRQALMAGGLIQPEQVPRVTVPFLKFHPTLAPVLWRQLTEAEKADLSARHRQQYYQLSGYLYHEDNKNPMFARAIVRRELPNLLMAVNGALAAGDADAADFVDNVSKFLGYFGLKQDQQVLRDKLAQVVGKVDSQAWYLTHIQHGEALYEAGRHADAIKVFEEILAGLGDRPSYEQCVTLNRLGRCLKSQGRVEQAATYYRQGLTVAAQLEQSEGVKRQRGVLHTDLAEVLMVIRNYDGAKESHEAALEIAKAQGDDRTVGVVEGQLGTLAMVQGELREAAERHQAALTTFQQLGEPAGEAAEWHQLGRVYEKARQSDKAEQYYRKAAQIKEVGGDLAGAARTWNQIAVVCQLAGRVEGAIAWYEKAVAGAKASADEIQTSRSLSNLAGLLQSQQNAAGQFPHLATARQHAEAALAIDQTLDPAAAEIWKTYGLLAAIAEKQGQAAVAQGYREQARQAKAAFAGTQYELRRYGPLIAAVVSAANGNEEVKAQLLSQREEAEQSGASNLFSAIHRILEGERDEAALVETVEPLSLKDSMIVIAILQGIADPSSLERFAAEEQP
jgi:tetratricopeptide (TPR) repeat protein